MKDDFMLTEVGYFTFYEPEFDYTPYSTQHTYTLEEYKKLPPNHPIFSKKPKPKFKINKTELEFGIWLAKLVARRNKKQQRNTFA